MTLKAAARWVNVTLKQKGKEVFYILEKFDLFLNSLSHGSIICNVSRVKLLSEFFSLEAQYEPEFLVGESYHAAYPYMLGPVYMKVGDPR